MPLEVAVACGLRPGLELDRPGLRRLRTELRRSEALAAAGRALRHHELSSVRVEAELERRRVAPAERRRALETLERSGLVDDRRFAEARARGLAERCYGDAAIRWRLAEEGVEDELAEAAVGLLEPESERAERIVARRGVSDRTLRLLARHGFAEDVLETLAWQSER